MFLNCFVSTFWLFLLTVSALSRLLRYLELWDSRGWDSIEVATAGKNLNDLWPRQHHTDADRHRHTYIKYINPRKMIRSVKWHLLCDYGRCRTLLLVCRTASVLGLCVARKRLDYCSLWDCVCVCAVLHGFAVISPGKLWIKRQI